MVKSYLRYGFEDQFGLVSGRECGSVFDYNGKIVFTGSNEFVYQWNPRTNERMAELYPSEENANIMDNTVTCIKMHPFQQDMIAVGYHNGAIRLWNVESQCIICTFHGHKSRVTVLQFSLDGHLLVSGGSDTDIVVWDVTSRLGLYRLNGHTNQVTALRFLHNPVDVELYDDNPSGTSKNVLRKRKTKKKASETAETHDQEGEAQTTHATTHFRHMSRKPSYLLSGSKDGSIRLWDLTTQWCIQAVFEPAGEVWSVVVNPSETRVVVGTAAHELRIYLLDFAPSPGDSLTTTTEYRETPRLREWGSITRPSGASRLSQLCYVTDFNTFLTNYNKYGQGIPLVSKDLFSDCDAGHGTTPYGTLLTGRETHSCIQNQGYLLLALIPGKKIVEIYRECPESERIVRRHKRLRRVNEKLKKKIQKLEELNTLCKQFENEMQSGKRTTIGTTYDMEREATLQKIQLASEEMNELKSQTEDKKSFKVSDELVFLQTFYLKKKPLFWDYSALKETLLISFNDGSVRSYVLPLRALFQLKNKMTCEALSVKKNVDKEDIEDIKLKDTLQYLSVGHPCSMTAMFMSHDDSVIGSLADKNVFIWHLDSMKQMHSMELTEQPLCGFFLIGNTHAVVGTSAGTVIILDIYTCCVVDKCCEAHKGRIVGMTQHPKGTSFVTTSADKTVQFFRFKVNKIDTKNNLKSEVLTCEPLASYDIPDEGCDVKFTPDCKYLAVAMLNFTIQIFFVDTMKLFLTLYGHTLPCNSIDISSDSTLLVTGSCDKTIKLWGLDFGNIQRSWIAHENDITQVQFIKGTHYVLSAGKDGHIMLWDGDTCTMITQLQRHSKPVCSLLTTSYDADRILAGMVDGSLRIWRRTAEQIFSHEEEEKILEKKLDHELERSDVHGAINPLDTLQKATRRTIMSVKTTEQLLHALELCTESGEQLEGYKEALKTWNDSLDANDAFSKMLKPVPPTPHPDLLGVSPHHFLYQVMSELPSSLQYEIVVALPFAFVEKLLSFLGDILEENECTMRPRDAKLDCMTNTMETIARMSLLLIHLHAKQFIVCPGYRKCLMKIHRYLRPLLLRHKVCLERNNSAFALLQRTQDGLWFAH